MSGIDLESILRETTNGPWVSDALPAAGGGSREQGDGSELGVMVSKLHSYLKLRYEWYALP